MQNRLKSLFAKKSAEPQVKVPNDPTNKQIMELIVQMQKEQQQNNADLRQQLAKLEDNLNK